MKYRIMKVNLIAALFFVSAFGYSQGEYIEVQDFETWSGINLKYKLNDKWTTTLKTQLRLDANSTEVSQYFGQLGVSYSLFKNFKLGGALRTIKKNDNTGAVQGYEKYFRYHLEGIFKHKLNDFKFKYRVRYQSKNEVGSEDFADTYIRFKAGVVYNIKKWKLDPEFSGELFNSLGEDSENKLAAYRLTLGTSFKLSKAGEMGVYYRYEQELNEQFPKTRNIIGLKYTYTLKK